MTKVEGGHIFHIDLDYKHETWHEEEEFRKACSRTLFNRFPTKKMTITPQPIWTLGVSVRVKRLPTPIPGAFMAPLEVGQVGRLSAYYGDGLYGITFQGGASVWLRKDHLELLP